MLDCEELVDRWFVQQQVSKFQFEVSELTELTVTPRARLQRGGKLPGHLIPWH